MAWRPLRGYSQAVSFARSSIQPQSPGEQKRMPRVFDRILTCRKGRRAVALPAGAAALLALCIPGGCVQFDPSGSRAASQPAPIAFVYPPTPPMVGEDELRNLLVRMDARRTVLWVFEDATVSGPTAQALAAGRDALRSRGIALLALYNGPPSDWSNRVVPMLKTSGANFICAVADPPRRPALGKWLSANPTSPTNGIYVLSADRRVITQTDGDPDAARRLVDALAKSQQQRVDQE